jgi:hypothetical protein
VVYVQDFPAYMMTPNLHMVRCHFTQMEDQWGPVSNMGELFMERSVQSMKSTVKGRVCSEPEKSILRAELLRTALSKLPKSGTDLFDKLIPAHSAAPLQ